MHCFIGIQEYFLHRLAPDDQQNANYRSLIEGQNYLSSGWIGQIGLLHTLPDEEHRAPVRFSQTINRQHNVELTLQRLDGRVVNVYCDCMAKKGKCCSHTAGVPGSCTAPKYSIQFSIHPLTWVSF